MKLTSLDHLVLTVQDLGQTVAFYTSVLGMEQSVSGQGRVSLHYGSQKINLHLVGAEFKPSARQPRPGSADLCFIVAQSIDEIGAELERKGIAIIEGPVERTGAVGSIRSVYIRDPDGNLVELSHYT